MPSGRAHNHLTARLPQRERNNSDRAKGCPRPISSKAEITISVSHGCDAVRFLRVAPHIRRVKISPVVNDDHRLVFVVLGWLPPESHNVSSGLVAHAQLIAEKADPSGPRCRNRRSHLSTTSRGKILAPIVTYPAIPHINLQLDAQRCGAQPPSRIITRCTRFRAWCPLKPSSMSSRRSNR